MPDKNLFIKINQILVKVLYSKMFWRVRQREYRRILKEIFPPN